MDTHGYHTETPTKGKGQQPHLSHWPSAARKALESTSVACPLRSPFPLLSPGLSAHFPCWASGPPGASPHLPHFPIPLPSPPPLPTVPLGRPAVPM